LEAFARSRKLFPAFLFDTISPFPETVSSRKLSGVISTVSPPTTPPVENRGGRPAEYDWDSFTMEIIRRANAPDGLPEIQAELIRDMLQWFSDTYDAEPAESGVKNRISKIYNYLKKAKNS
jgi:hypothetical protein